MDVKERLPVEELIQKAKEGREHAYAPYSHFKVGAALLTKSGRIFTGCNVENAAYSPGNCAERTAVFKAVSEGEREFAALCIIGGAEAGCLELCPPCGVCRQVSHYSCHRRRKMGDPHPGGAAAAGVRP